MLRDEYSYWDWSFGSGYGVGEYDGPVYVGAKEVRVEKTPNNGNYCYCVANKDGFVLYLDEKYYKIYKEGPDEEFVLREYVSTKRRENEFADIIDRIIYYQWKKNCRVFAENIDKVLKVIEEKENELWKSDYCKILLVGSIDGPIWINGKSIVKEIPNYKDSKELVVTKEGFFLYGENIEELVKIKGGLYDKYYAIFRKWLHFL